MITSLDDETLENTLEMELNAKPIVSVSGHFSPSNDQTVNPSYKQNILSILAKAEPSLPAVHLETCDINKNEMSRCGRRGVPKKRCTQIGCCWNKSWRPGGTFENFIFHTKIHKFFR